MQKRPCRCAMLSNAKLHIEPYSHHTSSLQALCDEHAGAVRALLEWLREPYNSASDLPAAHASFATPEVALAALRENPNVGVYSVVPDRAWAGLQLGLGMKLIMQALLQRDFKTVQTAGTAWTEQAGAYRFFVCVFV